MPATLHIIDPNGPGEPMLPALARHIRGSGGEVAILGGGAEAYARAAGLRSFHRIAPALGRAEWAGPALRTLARRLRANEAIAWSPGAAAAAAWTGIAAATVVATTPDRSSLPARAAVRSLARQGRVVFVGESTRAAWRAGSENAAVAEAPCSPAPIAPRRAAVRSGWGIGAAPVVGLLDADGAGGPAVDAFFASFIAGMLDLTNRRVTMIAPRGARGLERGKRLMERHGGPWSVIPERRPVWAWLAGCDAVLCFGGEGVAQGWASQLGIPALSIGPERELGDDHLTTRRPRQVTARLLDALDSFDPASPPATRQPAGDFAAALMRIGASSGATAEPRALPALSP